ncbi:serine/arginine repetitive matrix protein 1-like [Nasonia vitripennis]|uniref:Uncharacterized protein n=1 Tax=Nasonia vitripennis TaxID=7425 RepID=A0A7M7Q0A8_NASVI|nr:serine/arginine repetitive matrix protein 1-like [Nasonia vitripennis]
MQRSAKMIDSAEMHSRFIAYATRNSVKLYTATTSVRKMEAVQVAEKVLLGALEQLKRAQLFVERAEERYWKEWAHSKLNHISVLSESEIVKGRVLQDGLARPPSPRAHAPSDARAEGDESRESDSPPNPPSHPSPRAHTTAEERAEGDSPPSPPSPPSLPSPLSPPSLPSPRVYAPSDERAEGDESRETASPLSPPSPRVQVRPLDVTEWDNNASPRARTLTAVSAEGNDSRETVNQLCPPSLTINSEQPAKKRNKHSVLQYQTREEEPKLKKAKIENRYILVPNQQRLFISTDVLIYWITWFWKSPANRGIEEGQPKTKINKTKSQKKDKKGKAKKTHNNTETEEEKERKREKDRIRKREQRRKLKEEAQNSRPRVPLQRLKITTKHPSSPQPPLFTSCTGCREDCWYQGIEHHTTNWILCVVCRTNWANGECVHRIPYECRICKLKRRS